MSLQSRLAALITAVGADIKALYTLSNAQGAFMVGLQGAFSLSATIQAIPFSRTSTHAFDPANWWSTANKRHTPQKTGRWTYQYNMRLAGSSAPNQKFWIGLYKNDVLIAMSGPWYAQNSSEGFGSTFPSVIMNGTTDYVDLRANSDSSSWPLSVDDTTNWFAGHFIGN